MNWGQRRNQRAVWTWWTLTNNHQGFKDITDDKADDNEVKECAWVPGELKWALG